MAVQVGTGRTGMESVAWPSRPAVGKVEPTASHFPSPHQHGISQQFRGNGFWHFFKTIKEIMKPNAEQLGPYAVSVCPGGPEGSS